MARTGLFSSSRGLTHVAVLASLLILTALCIAQDANQSSATRSVITLDEKGEPIVTQVPADANNVAPVAPAAEAPSEMTRPAEAAMSVVVPGKAEPNQGGPQADVLTPLEQRMRKTVSVEFRETPIADVVRQLGAQADVDIILSPKVVGNATATLTDVPLDEALNNILAVQGATYIAGKNMIRVVPLGDVTMEQAKMVTKVYRIMYADVKDVAAALEKFISKNGQVSYAVGTSNIIVTDTEDKVKSIDTFMAEIDRITPQILVEARIYDISADDSIDLGIRWQAGRIGADGTVTGDGFTAVGQNRTFGPGGIGTLGNVITHPTKGDNRTDPFTNGLFDSPTNKTGTGDSLLRVGFLNQHVNIDAILKAEQKSVSAKLLANPRVLVLDNEKADIKIIQELPYQELSQTSGGGNIGTTQFKNVGVELHVTPHVTSEGLIRLKLNPIFSTHTSDFFLAIPGTSSTSQVPVIDTREENTIALVKDGETVVLGGLRQKTTNEELSKVPLLGDIPIIGLIFRFKGEEVVNSELVVFVTPSIKTHPTMTQEETMRFQQTEITPPVVDEKLLLNKLKKN